MTQGQLEKKLSENNINYLVLDGEKLKNVIIKDKSLVIIHSSKNLKFESQMLDQGALGVFWCPGDAALIDNLISTLNHGGLWFDRVTLTNKIKHYDNHGIKLNLKVDDKKLIKSLTKREVEIAKLVILGLSNKEIAEMKFISETTVKSHLKNILSKADVKNRTSLGNKLKL
ncbi:response regulator transcription factor [Pseudoalteromonas sp.]|uniref:response regulator transcription factor n=1 Tax=unclassified Pseudoalteromonas TaxID=194690 RepID=UPI003F9D4C7F